MRVFIAILFTIALGINFQSSGQTASDRKKPVRKPMFAAEKMIDDVRYLADDKLEGRGLGSPGSALARTYLKKRFGEVRLKPLATVFESEFEINGRGGKKYTGVNLLGLIPGKKYRDKYIVVSAHYDHLGIENGEIYNGADDNASGTAALIAIAEYFGKHQPLHSVVIAAFDAEESGLRGSKNFVENPPVKLESVIANINLDMVSHNDKNELYAAGTALYPQLLPIVEASAKTAPVKLLTGHDRPELGINDWTFQSDHAPFHLKKIPFLYFGVEDHKDYHKPTDDFANINQKFYIAAVETIIDVTKRLDENLSAPTKRNKK